MFDINKRYAGRQSLKEWFKKERPTGAKAIDMLSTSLGSYYASGGDVTKPNLHKAKQQLISEGLM